MNRHAFWLIFVLAWFLVGAVGCGSDEPDTSEDGDIDVEWETFDTDGDSWQPLDGDVIDGDVTDGDVTDGDVTDGDVTDGDVTDGDVTDGDVTDGDVTDGDVTDGDVTDGDVTDGDVTDGDVTDGDVTDGDVTDGDVTDGDVTDGDVTDGDVTDGDVELSTRTVHFWSGWTQPYLYYRTEDTRADGWVDFPGEAFSSEDSLWWVATVDKPVGVPLVFLMNDGVGDGTGEDTDWHYPDGCTGIGCYFEVYDTEFWVLDGVVYTQRPEDPVDGDTDGDVTDGDVTDGDVTDGDSDGDVTDGDVTDGDVTDGDVTDGDSDGDVTDGDVEPVLVDYTIHFWSGWTQPYFYWSDEEGADGSWTAFPGSAMNAEDTLWWQSTAQVPEGTPLTFLFNDGQGDGETGTDWHYPDGCSGFGCHFITSNTEVWVRDGVVYTTRPPDPEVTFTVHVYPDWPQPYFYFSNAEGADGSWNSLPGIEMTDEGDGWFMATATIPIGRPLHFLFNDGEDNGGDGAYWYYPEGCSGPGCEFITSDHQVWVLDGVLSQTKPSVPTTTYTVHLAATWSPPYFFYSLNEDAEGSWTFLPGVAMSSEGDGWWVATATIRSGRQLQYLFNDGVNDGGAGATWYYPSTCPGGDCDFLTSTTEVWVKDGVEYDHFPVDPTTTYTVHHRSGWTQPYLYYSDNEGADGSWNALPGDAMSSEGNGWWVSTATIPEGLDLHFLFNDGVNGGGSGASWHYPYGCTGEGCEFSTSVTEVWVKDGEIFTTQPTETTYTIHTYTGWQTPYLYFSDEEGADGSWTTSPGVAMTYDTGYWWTGTATIPIEYELVFLISNGKSGDDLDWHHPSSCSGEGCNFQTPFAETWVVDGQMYDSQPSEPSTTYTVHIDVAWSQVYMYYSLDGDHDAGWIDYPGAQFTNDGGNWWVVTVTLPFDAVLVFLPHDNSGDAGSTNWYRPSGCGDCNFSTDDTEVWIQNGQLLNDAP